MRSGTIRGISREWRASSRDIKSQRERIQREDLVKVSKVKHMVLEGGKKSENKPHSFDNSAQGQKGGKIIWWLGTPMGPELAETKATFREVSLTTIMIISVIRSSSFVTTKIDWRRWNCLSWTREITGRHEICFQIPQSSWKTRISFILYHY